MYETHETTDDTIFMSFYYRYYRYTIGIDRYRYIIKCQKTGAVKPREAFAKKISLSSMETKYTKPMLRGAKIAKDYLVIYSSYDVIVIKLENLLKKRGSAVRSTLYHVSEVVDAYNWRRMPIVDVLYIGHKTIAVGLTDTADKQVAVAFIDFVFDTIKHTGKFGSNISLIKLAKRRHDIKIMALCDHGTSPWVYNPQLDVYGNLEIYTIDTESAIVVSKTTVN
jgi:hypothetical protein